MLRLLDRSYGNRSPDDGGNLHTRFDDRGLTVFRDPGRYTGLHRRHTPGVLALLTGWLAGV